MHHSASLLTCVLCALTACSPMPTPIADAGSTPDASSASDGSADTAVAPDAATSDVGTPDAGGPPEDASPPDAAACPTGGGPPSAQLIALHTDLIRPGCVGAGRTCHEGGTGFGFGMGSPEGMLTNVVGVAGCMGVRVVPCSPGESFLLSVIRTGGEPCGPPFPSGAGASHPTFAPAEISAIEDWIRAGAR